MISPSWLWTSWSKMTGMEEDAAKAVDHEST